jgi:hypothetical protein
MNWAVSLYIALTYAGGDYLVPVACYVTLARAYLEGVLLRAGLAWFLVQVRETANRENYDHALGKACVDDAFATSTPEREMSGSHPNPRFETEPRRRGKTVGQKWKRPRKRYVRKFPLIFALPSVHEKKKNRFFSPSLFILLRLFSAPVGAR